MIFNYLFIVNSKDMDNINDQQLVFIYFMNYNYVHLGAKFFSNTGIGPEERVMGPI